MHNFHARYAFLKSVSVVVHLIPAAFARWSITLWFEARGKSSSLFLLFELSARRWLLRKTRRFVDYDRFVKYISLGRKYFKTPFFVYVLFVRVSFPWEVTLQTLSLSLQEVKFLCKTRKTEARYAIGCMYARRQVESIDAQRRKGSGVASPSVLRRRARNGDRPSTLTKFSNTVIEVCDYADAWCTLVYRCSKTVEAEAVTAVEPLDHSSCIRVKLGLCGATPRQATGDYNGIYARLAYELRIPLPLPLPPHLLPAPFPRTPLSLSNPFSSFFDVSPWILLSFRLYLYFLRLPIYFASPFPLGCSRSSPALCTIYSSCAFLFRPVWASDFEGQQLHRIARYNVLWVHVSVNFGNRYLDGLFAIFHYACRYISAGFCRVSCATFERLNGNGKGMNGNIKIELSARKSDNCNLILISFNRFNLTQLFDIPFFFFFFS